MNTFIGHKAGLKSLGDRNTFIGGSSGLETTTGATNTFIGEFVGDVNTVGSRNVLVGHTANVSANNLTNAMALGTGAIVDVSNKVRIGDASVTVIEGQVDWSFPADRRFKKNVRENVRGLDLILKLRPVTYQFDIATYNAHRGIPTLDQAQRKAGSNNTTHEIIQTGFIAQDVESAAKSLNYKFSGLVKPQNKKDNYGLRYSTFVVPLVKAVQEQQDLILQQQSDHDSQELKIKQLESRIIQLTKTVEQLLERSQE